jgi:hypothetical protein
MPVICAVRGIAGSCRPEHDPRLAQPLVRTLRQALSVRAWLDLLQPQRHPFHPHRTRRGPGAGLECHSQIDGVGQDHRTKHRRARTAPLCLRRPTFVGKLGALTIAEGRRSAGWRSRETRPRPTMPSPQPSRPRGQRVLPSQQSEMVTHKRLGKTEITGPPDVCPAFPHNAEYRRGRDLSAALCGECHGNHDTVRDLVAVLTWTDRVRKPCRSYPA